MWTTVTREDRAADRLPYEVTEDVIDEVRRTDEAEVAVVFKESDDGLWHVSARSKGRVDVARAAIALGGGGHSQAAGFTTVEDVPDALARLRVLLAVPDEPGPVSTSAAGAAEAAAGDRAGRAHHRRQAGGPDLA